MDESAYLRSYDPHAFPAVAVATDVVLFTMLNGELRLVPVSRAEQPQRGRLSLPGTFVRSEEDLDAAAYRALYEKVGISRRARQFRSFGAVDRDPRMRVVSVAYIALCPLDQLSECRPDPAQLLMVDGDRLRDARRRLVRLAFDHDAIVSAALTFLRRELDMGLWIFELLPAEFTLRELQQVHEAVRGQSINKPAFRKRLLESGKLEATGRLEAAARFRPAELYRVNHEWSRDEG